MSDHAAATSTVADGLLARAQRPAVRTAPPGPGEPHGIGYGWRGWPDGEDGAPDGVSGQESGTAVTGAAIGTGWAATGTGDRRVPGDDGAASPVGWTREPSLARPAGEPGMARQAGPGAPGTGGPVVRGHGAAADAPPGAGDGPRELRHLTATAVPAGAAEPSGDVAPASPLGGPGSTGFPPVSDRLQRATGPADLGSRRAQEVTPPAPVSGPPAAGLPPAAGQGGFGGAWPQSAEPGGPPFSSRWPGDGDMSSADWPSAGEPRSASGGWARRLAPPDDHGVVGLDATHPQQSRSTQIGGAFSGAAGLGRAPAGSHETNRRTHPPASRQLPPVTIGEVRIITPPGAARPPDPFRDLAARRLGTWRAEPPR